MRQPSIAGRNIESIPMNNMVLFYNHGKSKNIYMEFCLNRKTQNSVYITVMCNKGKGK